VRSTSCSSGGLRLLTARPPGNRLRLVPRVVPATPCEGPTGDDFFWLTGCGYVAHVGVTTGRCWAVGVMCGLSPRDSAVATRSAVVMSAVASLLTLAVAVIAPVSDGPLSTAVSFVVPVTLVVLCVVLSTVPERWRSVMCLATPVVGVIAVAALDLATRDASAAGQVFLCYPVLYAASRLRPGGAWVVVATAITADTVVALSLESVGRGLTDLVYVGVTLATMTALLSRAGQRQDALVARLSAQAAIDPLTGLVTRRVLDDATQSAISGAAEQSGTALILIDLDRFKVINDTYGHPIGDDALVHVAALLRAQSRPDSVVGRVGGDELAVLLPGCPVDAAARRAQEFIAAIRENPLVLADGTIVTLSISIGLAQVPSHASSLRELYAAADAALYRAKRAGRDQVGLPLPTAV
jgi:diguanylate cyclase (GGDEF)-like protein